MKIRVFPPKQWSSSLKPPMASHHTRLDRSYFILSKYFIQIFIALEKKEDIILFVKSPGEEENS